MSRDYYLCFIDEALQVRGPAECLWSHKYWEVVEKQRRRGRCGPRLFPWVGIAQALIFTQGGLSTQPDLPAGWPVFVSWVFTGHRLSCLPQRTTAPRRGRSQAGVQLVPPCLRFLRMKAWALLRVVSRAWRHLARGVKD